jgi:hypothetical protein
MSATKQSQAVGVANEILVFAGQMNALFTVANNLSTKYTNQGIQATLNALPTCVQNPDGSLGTPDVAPVTGNPINTNIITGLNRAVSAQKLIQNKAIMGEFVAFMANLAVTTKDRNATVDDLVGQ